MVHCKCLQGFTGTLQGNRSAGISNLWDCMYTRNPRNFVISTLWFPCKSCRDFDFTGWGYHILNVGKLCKILFMGEPFAMTGCTIFPFENEEHHQLKELKGIAENYHISSYSFRGNYSFLNCSLCTVTFDHSTTLRSIFKGEIAYFTSNSKNCLIFEKFWVGSLPNSM